MKHFLMLTCLVAASLAYAQADNSKAAVEIYSPNAAGANQPMLMKGAQKIFEHFFKNQYGYLAVEVNHVNRYFWGVLPNPAHDSSLLTIRGHFQACVVPTEFQKMKSDFDAKDLDDLKAIHEHNGKVQYHNARCYEEFGGRHGVCKGIVTKLADTDGVTRYSLEINPEQCDSLAVLTDKTARIVISQPNSADVEFGAVELK